jgi:2-polyprenyl-3-methyl-5-hydroxy-6-metoxy-1,4-benzoquinol methylase
MMISPKIRYVAKSLFIKTPVGQLGRWVRSKTGKREWYRNKKYWDAELAGPRATYLKGRGVDICNAVVKVLIEQNAPSAKTILDIGCARGELARHVDMDIYTGVDISHYAIEEANKQFAGKEESPGSRITFHCSDMCEYVPEPGEVYDLIVFNEVLYYLEIDEAIEQVQRYIKYLTTTGMLVISMKKDPKAEVILKRLLKQYTWIHGLLYQEQLHAAKHRIIINQERPAFLVGLLKVQ